MWPFITIVQDRMGRADAVWYERTEGQFSPRHSDRPVSRLQSASPFGFREPSEPPPEMPPRPNLVRRRSTDATLQATREPPDRVRRSFPQRMASGTALKAPVRHINSRNASPARSLSAAAREDAVDKAKLWRSFEAAELWMAMLAELCPQSLLAT
eukprot:Skav216479  [mRNA]  locus=scaffold1123:357051:367759:- [translate_table: standard]